MARVAVQGLLLGCALLTRTTLAAPDDFSRTAPEPATGKPQQAAIDITQWANQPGPVTGEIQKAVDRAAAQGGGTVTFGPGLYITGPIRLRSNVTVHLTKGAIVRGSPKIEDYENPHADPAYLKRFGKTAGRLALFDASKIENVAITGEGTIDGNCGAWAHFDRNENYEGPKGFRRERTRQKERLMVPGDPRIDGAVNPGDRPRHVIHIAGCRNFRIEGIRLCNAPGFTVSIGYSRGGSIRGIIIENDQRMRNDDGINMHSSRDIRVHGCRIASGDDAIAVSGEWSNHPFFAAEGISEEDRRMTSENIIVSDCTLRSRSAGIRVGFCGNDIRRCTFHDIVVQDSGRGIVVNSRDGNSVHDIAFRNIAITTRHHFRWGVAEPIHISAVPMRKGGSPGVIDQIRFSDIRAEAAAGIVLWASEPGKIKNVRIERTDCRVVNTPMTADFGGNVDLRGISDLNQAVFQRDTPALLAHEVDHLVLDNFHVAWDADLPDFFTYAVDLEDCGKTELWRGSGSYCGSRRPEAIRHAGGGELRLEKSGFHGVLRETASASTH